MNIIKTLKLPCGQTYFLQLVDGGIIECGDVFMSIERQLGTRPYRFCDFESPSDKQKRVITISTMSGCCCGCTFCASRNSFRRNLTTEEILAQIALTEQNGVTYGRLPSLSNTQELRALYTRMGEPLLNVDNVIASIKILINKYPKIVIGLSTCGYEKGLQKLMRHPEILQNIDMQFSLHSTDDTERDLLFDTKTGKNIMDIKTIGKYAREWKKVTGKAVSLNIILFSNYKYDIPKLMTHFDKDSIWLRLSPWNTIPDSALTLEGMLKTEDCIKKEPVSSEELRQIIQSIKSTGLAYAYAPAIDEEIKYNVACGQALLAYKN